jgi:nucleoside-diphosphate-sugar epimerase
MPDRHSYLIAGATGQVALPVAEALARDHDVVATARFSDPVLRERLEAAGATCIATDLVDGDVSALPADVDYVLNFSVMKTANWDRDLDGNVGGVGALMAHCKGARAVLHCSSTAVYQPNGHHAFREDDPLGDNHRVWDFLQTYSISKIAAEAMARYQARALDLPTTIARLNVPYGDNGGWPDGHIQMLAAGMPVPVHVDAPTAYNPIHEDDIIASVPKLLAAASVPVTTVNWGGDDVVSIEDWCTYLAGLMGVEATFAPTELHLESVMVDLTRMHEITGPTTVHWHDGFRRMLEHRHPNLVKASA